MPLILYNFSVPKSLEEVSGVVEVYVFVPSCYFVSLHEY